MAKLSIEEILEAVEQLSILELNDLVTQAEEKFGVSASAGVMVQTAGPAETEDAKTEFDVELTDVGENKIKVIKVVKDLLGLGLKEAKEAVEAIPKIIKDGISKDEAEEIKAKFAEVGAVVVIK